MTSSAPVKETTIVTFCLSKQLEEALEEYRKQHCMRSRSALLRELCCKALIEADLI